VTVALVVLASVVSLWLTNALQAFQILLQIGAGTGLVFLLRWYWWRINAWSEISAMVVSFVVAVYFQFVHGALGLRALDPSVALVTGVVVTTVGWAVVTLLTRPADRATLQSFYDLIRPLGPGWEGAGIATGGPAGGTGGDGLTAAFLAWFLGCATVYGALFGTGYLLYGSVAPGLACLALAAAAGAALLRLLPRVGLAGAPGGGGTRP
jgi:hypothetical protein